MGERVSIGPDEVRHVARLAELAVTDAQAVSIIAARRKYLPRRYRNIVL